MGADRALGVGAEMAPGVGAESSLLLYEGGMKSGELALYEAPGVRAEDEELLLEGFAEVELESMKESRLGRPGVLEPASQVLRSVSEA